MINLNKTRFLHSLSMIEKWKEKGFQLRFLTETGRLESAIFSET